MIYIEYIDGRIEIVRYTRKIQKGRLGLDKQLLPVFSWFRIIYQLFEFGEKERDTYNTPERDLMIAS